MFFAGWAVGAPLCSSLADRLGRKTLTLSVLPVAVLVGILPMLPDRRKPSEMALVFCCRLYLYLHLGVCMGLGAANSWGLVAAASAGLAASDGFGPPSLLRAAAGGTLLARRLHRIVGVWLRLDDGMDAV